MDSKFTVTVYVVSVVQGGQYSCSVFVGRRQATDCFDQIFDTDANVEMNKWTLGVDGDNPVVLKVDDHTSGHAIVPYPHLNGGWCTLKVPIGKPMGTEPYTWKRLVSRRVVQQRKKGKPVVRWEQSPVFSTPPKDDWLAARQTLINILQSHRLQLTGPNTTDPKIIVPPGTQCEGPFDVQHR